MSDDKRMHLLRSIELFRGLSEEELTLLAKHATERYFDQGALLYEQSGPLTDLFIIVQGEVELLSIGSFGEQDRIGYFGDGDFLGEGSWASHQPNATSARATTETTVLAVDSSFFQISPSATAKIFSNIIRVISRRLRHTYNCKTTTVAAQYETGSTRSEHDLLGYREVPVEYLYGIQTLRAIENFNISGITLSFFPELIVSLAMVKLGAARANTELGLLPEQVSAAICQACNEIIKGKYHNHFLVDMIQGGAGTSTNMNANEVIANRALAIMGFPHGHYEHCHPNNHVNLSQSTNDVYPSAVKIALIRSNAAVIAVLLELVASFRNKGREFATVIKMGRTQLQDAVPMTLGQSFEAYAETLDEEVARLNQNVDLFLELNMGATAIGTGINSDPDYTDKVIDHLRRITGLDLKKSKNMVEATQDTGAFVMYSSALKRLSVKLSKICNDLRLLSSGPRTGINEINLPPQQPGSSIMPGKVNPVIPEVVNQIAFKVIGNDLTVTLAAEAGQLELNVMEPVIVQSIFESLEMLVNGMRTLKHRCIDGITANEKHCRDLVKNSIGIVTALNPLLGYDCCTRLAEEALANNRSVYELVLEQGLLTKEELDEQLLPELMIKPRRMRRS
jgi:aspartate ammonia-lyase